jgi:UDP-N-acetyl-D-mannosaminuronate dehydrogenase
LRGTLAVPLISELRARFREVLLLGHDPAVTEAEMSTLGVAYAASATEAFAEADCVIFQNNNPKFEGLDIAELSRTMRPDSIIYDLWNQFDSETLSLRSDVRYFGLGTRSLIRKDESRSSEYAAK